MRRDGRFVHLLLAEKSFRQSVELPRTIGGRIANGCVSLLVATVTGVGVVMGGFEWKTYGWADGVLKFAVLELAFVFFLYFFFRLIWCLFTPPWMERLVERHAKRLMAASAVLIIGLTLGLVLLEAFGR